MRANQSGSSEGGGSSDNLDTTSSQYQLWRSVSTSGSKTKKGARCYGLGNVAYTIDDGEHQSSAAAISAATTGVSQEEYDRVRSQVATLSAAYEEQQRVNERNQRLYERQQRHLQELYHRMGLGPLPDEEDNDERDTDGGADH